MSDRNEKTSPMSQRKLERKQELIAAALRVFIRDGFTAAKMEDVASEAGMAKGTVYLYADSKVALFQDVIRDKILPVISEVEALFERHEGATVDLLRSQIRRFANEVLNEDRRQVVRLIITEGKHFPEIAGFYSEAVIERGMAAIRATVRKGIQSGEFRDLPLDYISQSLMGGIVLASMREILFGNSDGFDLVKLCDQHLEVVFFGILSR